MTNQTPSLPPGFRFHPTDEELILYYLKNRSASSPCPVSIIADVDIYKFDPWNLPDKATFGDKEWYFFTPRDRKYPNGVRPNRAAASGYWKATGTDKPIVTSNGNRSIGVKKALVFYKGKPPKGIKTNWIMHEYRLCETKNNINTRPLKLRDSSMRLDDWVLCRIYQKSSHLQEDSAPISNETNLAIHKSFSLSELLNEADFALLSQLLETPIQTNLNQPFVNMKNFSETELAVSVAEQSLKRKRIEEDRQNLLPQSSWVYSNFGDQFDSQSFFSQQLMMNSQFGMQNDGENKFSFN